MEWDRARKLVSAPIPASTISKRPISKLKKEKKKKMRQDKMTQNLFCSSRDRTARTWWNNHNYHLIINFYQHKTKKLVWTLECHALIKSGHLDEGLTFRKPLWKLSSELMIKIMYFCTSAQFVEMSVTTNYYYKQLSSRLHSLGGSYFL